MFDKARIRAPLHPKSITARQNHTIRAVQRWYGFRKRVIFTEGVLEPDRAMIELAKFRVERELTELVFGDPAGLHRDVLSEATRAYLATFPDVIDAFSVD